MGVLRTNSLARTVDAVNAASFYERRLPAAERRAAAEWIASRQGLPGSYAGTFALTEADRTEGVRLFTGERIGSGGGARHILGEEACRALLLLGVPHKEVRSALERATAGIAERLRMSRQRELNAGREWLGMYCCGRCTVSVWRHLTAGGLRDHEPEAWLEAGIRALGRYRKGDGRWRTFPFHYTLLALAELDLPAAVDEMRHAAPVCERAVARAPQDDEYARRGRLVAERVLAKC